MLHWFWGWGNNRDTSPKQLEHVDFSKAFKNQVSTYDHDHKHTEMPQQALCTGIIGSTTNKEYKLS